MKARNVNLVTDSGAEGEEDFKLDDFLPFRLAVAAASVTRLMARRLAESNKLAISEWRVLTVVGGAGVLSPSNVGMLASMDKVKVSRAAASLVARGLLKQSQDPHDGRGRLLRLTRKGAGVHRHLNALARETEAELAQKLSRTEWTALHHSLSRLETHALDLGAPEAQAEAAD
jgi:DNA-binding MarR family transcriptional regulator